MSSPSPSTSTGWFTGRTRLITFVSIVAVGLAGAAAVSANVGILDTASNSSVGNASITDDLLTPAVGAGAVDVPPTTVTAAGGADGTVHEFVVDVAGTVAVAASDQGLHLDHVAPAAGWRWDLSQREPTALLVTMSDGVRTLEFTATTTAAGDIAASVNEPLAAPAPAAIDDDDGDDDDHVDTDDDDHGDEVERHEYEGSDDDD